MASTIIQLTVAISIQIPDLTARVRSVDASVTSVTSQFLSIARLKRPHPAYTRGYVVLMLVIVIVLIAFFQLHLAI